MGRTGFIHDKLDIKFLVLYLMARVAGPVDFATLADLTFCDDGVEYFDFAESVAELVATEHLTLEDGYYSITEKGQRNGKICESSLAFSVRRKCDRNLARVNGVLRRDAQVRSEILPREDGGVTLRLILDDDKGNIMTLDMLAPDEAQGQLLADAFLANPDRLYNSLLGKALPRHPAGAAGGEPGRRIIEQIQKQPASSEAGCFFRFLCT